MRLTERIFAAIESLHLFLARWLQRFFGALWRFQGGFSLQFRFFIAFVFLGGVLAAAAYLLPDRWCAWAGLDAPLVRYLQNAGHLAYGVQLRILAIYGAGLCIAAALLSLVRLSVVFRVMECAWAYFTAVAFLVFRWTLTAPSILVSCDHKAFDSAMRNNLWTGSFAVALLLAVPVAAVFVAIVSTGVRAYYHSRPSPGSLAGAGERIVDSLRTGGRDPRFRSSLYWTVSLFLAVLFLPYLMFSWGWEEPYGLPKGSGQPKPQQVQVKKIKPKKKPKKLTVNPWSPYILTRMNIDDVQTLKELEEETKDTYETNRTPLGGGKGPGNGGWPQGMEGAAVRFIRLKYRGGDWDQDMGKGADYNLLIKFHEWTGLKIARETEAREIVRLKFFPKKKSPPFVFLTGSKGLSVSDSEVKVLREYCENEGGMLFIDNGGGYFDGQVRSLLRRVFPGKPLVDIPNDDTIYQKPYVFPDGAPPFWHHAGYRALGVRSEGRWMVFYHPGDINDAWKDDHSGASAEVAEQAYKLGVNVIYYAFTQYYRRHYEQ